MSCLYFSICLIFLQSLAYGSHLLQQRKFNDYKVVVVRDESLEGQRLIIKKAGKIVYNEGEPGSYFWIGNHFDDSLKNDPHSGYDLTGNGIPELIISQWTGGAHCCNILSIFEMNDVSLKKLTSVDGGSYGFEIKDLDNDGLPEITFWDWPIDYLFNAFAHSAQGKTILKFTDGQYRVSAKLMYKRRPDYQKLERLMTEIREDFLDEGDRVPYSLLELMMTLNYTGYKELALTIAKETWPKERNDFKDFKIKFKESLNDSIYWREFDLGNY